MNQARSQSSDVYIAGTSTILPELFSASVAADYLYPPRLCSERINAFAKRVAANFRIRERGLCIDLERVPEIVLKDRNNHPLEWCVSLAEDLTRVIPKEEIGYVGVAYNTTLHTNTLPNLACQTAMRLDIHPEKAPEEFAHYGCAGGLFPLESAIDYCRHNQKAALVIVFDQCTSRGSFCYDPDDKMFKMDLRVNLLFSDGAAGVLLIPRRLRNIFSQALPKIEDIAMTFKISNMIKFEDDRFILGDSIRNEVPPFVAASVIKPIFSQGALSPSEVEEWSIHQGCLEILDRFGEPEVLGLSAGQLARSKELFERYGNLSAPSCFLILDSFFKDRQEKKPGTLGMIVAFGAGFYEGAVLYRWN